MSIWTSIGAIAKISEASYPRLQLERYNHLEVFQSIYQDDGVVTSSIQWLILAVKRLKSIWMSIGAIAKISALHHPRLQLERYNHLVQVEISTKTTSIQWLIITIHILLQVGIWMSIGASANNICLSFPGIGTEQ